MNMNDIPNHQDTIHQSGFTIIEVLIAIAIFSIGFMAVGALQTGALRSGGASQDRTNAMEALNAQVDVLKRTPLYALDIYDFGSTAAAHFEMSPEFEESDDPQSEVYGEYTVYWWADNQHTIADRWTGGTPVVVSENITATVARNGADPIADALNQVEFVKYWVTDN
jgi:prepilin-type N-terminal cleavage/methylation domain-containing protein